MNLLITAGGTSEKIDDVRHLTNHATGTLGKEIAHSLEKDDVTIYYIHGPQAVLPKNKEIKFFSIHSVQELYQTMEELLTTISFDYVIHSMAVSDYELDTASNEELLAKKIAQTIEDTQPKSQETLVELIKNTLMDTKDLSQPTQKKISSKNEKLILIMGKAPKVITKIKEWQPNTKLIGFKLLVDVSEEELVNVAKESIIKNQADWILANDLTTINGDNHIGLLVSNSGIDQRFSTKKEIAQGLRNLVLTNK
ncbi:phosphopantothenate--cysteine ligase [Vagococcus sp.]|uniref:phosphopantothenate--cysteine ligase n=1 Tax=Vagococcus sp. TaxID=1933889 RepID=UPI002FCC899C